MSDQPSGITDALRNSPLAQQSIAHAHKCSPRGALAKTRAEAASTGHLDEAAEKIIENAYLSARRKLTETRARQDQHLWSQSFDALMELYQNTVSSSRDNVFPGPWGNA